jgi:flavin reductase (DIM6/NTAB) family NADH-FMN oxidoreductase RutF
MDFTTLFKVSYGMYVIGSRSGSNLNGQIANTVFQITSEPPRIAVSINKKNLTHEYINERKAFSVSILSEEAPMTLIGNFGFKSGRDIDKFENYNYKFGSTGVPILLDKTVGYLEAKVIEQFDIDTHTIFIGKVVDSANLSTGLPMTYSYYHEIKKGRSPKTAPTYVEKEKLKEVNRVKKYRCKVCGYIYDPEVGDPDSGIESTDLHFRKSGAI